MILLWAPIGMNMAILDPTGPVPLLKYFNPLINIYTIHVHMK